MVATLSRICGLIAPLIGIAFVWIAVNNSPWFRWTQEDLSVLGVDGSATGFFRWGLALSGLFSLVFVTGLGSSVPLRQPLGYIAVLTLILGSLGLMLVGLVPRTNPLPHNIGSVAYFSLIPAGLFLAGIAFVRSTSIAWGIFSIAAAVLMIALELVPWPWPGGSIPQLLASLPWALWLITVAAALLLGNIRS